MEKSMSKPIQDPGPYKPKPKTPKRLRVGIRLDGVNPIDYLKYEMPFACEDCTHFNIAKTSCTLGYNSIHHLRENQKNSYILSGKMALCRFLEID
jgi:hypothetical protein